jgi:hypothetical protein
MPLYRVRWPWLKASLVSARDEDDLLDTLDQVDDAEGATWSVYRGPLWIDFEIPAEIRIDEKAPREPLRSDEIAVHDVRRVELGGFEVSSPGCDQTSEMHEKITMRAFPELFKVLYGAEGGPTEGEVKGAVHSELQRLATAEWRRASRAKRTDPVGQIAHRLGAPVRQVENVLRRAGHLSERPPDPSQASIRRLPRKARRGRPKGGSRK